MHADAAQRSTDGGVDVALVLAVDVSASIDAAAFQLQRQGYAAAFRDPRVIDAIHQGAKGEIAVTVMQWASATEQQQVVPWTRIADFAAAEAFATALAAAGRMPFAGGSTSLSGAIAGGMRLLASFPQGQERAVIDISGDGSNNNGRPPEPARDEAVRSGITINGLAILADEPLLARYFEDRVIGGPGAFVVTVGSSAGIADALVAKLVREIADASDAASPLRAAGAASRFAPAFPR